MKNALVLVLLVASSAVAQPGSADQSFKQSGPLSIARPMVDKLRDIANVKDFGAKCDGVTNDGPAIKAALTWAAAAGNSVTMTFPPGSCFIGTTGLTLPSKLLATTGITLQGTGSLGSSIVYTGSGTALTIGTAGSGNANTVNYIYFDNIKIDCSRATAATTNGVVIQNFAAGGMTRTYILGPVGGPRGGVGLSLLAGVWTPDQNVTDFSVNYAFWEVTVGGDWTQAFLCDGYNINKNNGHTFSGFRVYRNTPPIGLSPASGGPTIGFHWGSGCGDGVLVGTNDVTGYDIGWQIDGANLRGEARTERNSVGIAYGSSSFNNDIRVTNADNANDHPPGQGVPIVWQPNTTYPDTGGRLPNGFFHVYNDNVGGTQLRLYRRTGATSCLSAAAGVGPTGTGASIVDNTCKWAWVGDVHPPAWRAAQTYPVGQFVQNLSNTYRIVGAGRGKTAQPPTGGGQDISGADGYHYSFINPTVAIPPIPGIGNSFRHTTDAICSLSPGGAHVGECFFRNQGDGPLWFEWQAGAQSQQPIYFQFLNQVGAMTARLGVDATSKMFVDTGAAFQLSGLPLQLSRVTASPKGGVVVINAAQGNEFVVTPTDSSPFQFRTPANPLAGQRITIRVRNTVGTGAVAFTSVYKMAAWGAPPARGFSRAIDFQYDGVNWIEVSRTPADIPN